MTGPGAGQIRLHAGGTSVKCQPQAGPHQARSTWNIRKIKMRKTKTPMPMTDYRLMKIKKRGPEIKLGKPVYLDKDGKATATRGSGMTYIGIAARSTGRKRSVIVIQP